MSAASALEFWPIRDFGPLMKGAVMGGVGIVHVFLAQFAVGAGALLVVLERRAQRFGDRGARRFVDGFFKTLVLVSFVLGALTGVGVWLTAIQVSPATISLMVAEFHWIWAAEWCFFVLEVASGYAFYRFGPRLSDRLRMRLLVQYAVASWFSLALINGILSWQLTPGSWPERATTAAGFFNPGFWPSLCYRTVASWTLAALAACVVSQLPAEPAAGEAERAARAGLVRRFGLFLAPMAAMPALGLWFLAVLPPDSRSWLLGGSAAMSLFLALAVGASLCIGLYALAGLRARRPILGVPTAALLLVLALGATAGGEFVREGVRKPFSVRQTLYSNSIRPEQVARLRERGSVTDDPYPLRDAERYPNDQLRLGARVYRLQCSVCHTLSGTNGLRHLTETWTLEQMRMNVAKLQWTKPFMPPFAGNARELEALVQRLAWLAAGEPAAWPESDLAALRPRLEAWLAEAGTERARPGDGVRPPEEEEASR